MLLRSSSINNIIKYHSTIKCYSILSCIHNSINGSDSINDLSGRSNKTKSQEYRLIEDELEEKFVRGHGPGGQSF